MNYSIGYRIVGYIWYASKQLIWFLIFSGGKIGGDGFKNYSKTMNITLNKQTILNSLLYLRQWRSQLFSSWRNLYKSFSSRTVFGWFYSWSWAVWVMCAVEGTDLSEIPFFYPACLSLLIWYIVVTTRKFLVFCFLSSLISPSLSKEIFYNISLSIIFYSFTGLLFKA